MDETTEGAEAWRRAWVLRAQAAEMRRRAERGGVWGWVWEWLAGRCRRRAERLEPEADAQDPRV
jgi:hypothetical protein